VICIARLSSLRLENMKVHDATDATISISMTNWTTKLASLIKWKIDKSVFMRYML
jgi:hypothetical protein